MSDACRSAAVPLCRGAAVRSAVQPCCGATIARCGKSGVKHALRRRGTRARTAAPAALQHRGTGQVITAQPSSESSRRLESVRIWPAPASTPSGCGRRRLWPNPGNPRTRATGLLRREPRGARVMERDRFAAVAVENPSIPVAAHRRSGHEDRRRFSTARFKNVRDREGQRPIGGPGVRYVS
jgi:hypothetical protein